MRELRFPRKAAWSMAALTVVLVLLLVPSMDLWTENGIVQAQEPSYTVCYDCNNLTDYKHPRPHPYDPDTFGCPNCTWYAYFRREDMPAHFNLGNAGDWDDSAESQLWSVGLEARSGATVVFESGHPRNRGSGHVAHVESVDDYRGTYTFREMNYLGTCENVDTRSYPESDVSFIYGKVGARLAGGVFFEQVPGNGFEAGKIHFQAATGGEAFNGKFAVYLRDVYGDGYRGETSTVSLSPNTQTEIASEVLAFPWPGRWEVTGICYVDPVWGDVPIPNPDRHLPDARYEHSIFFDVCSDGTVCSGSQPSWAFWEPKAAHAAGPSCPNDAIPFQNSDLVVGQNPASAGTDNTFTFEIYNNGGLTQLVTEIFVQGTLPDGETWKAWATAQDIPSCESRTFVATAPMWGDKLGTWTIEKVVYKDSAGNFFNLSANGHLQAQSFVVQGSQEPADLVQASDLSVGLNPAHPGQDNTFTFEIFNGGDLTLQMDEIFVQGKLPNGDIWKAWATPQNVNGGQTKTFVATAPMWGDHLGPWEIRKIVYKDSAGVFYDLPANGHLQGQKFAVLEQGSFARGGDEATIYYVDQNKAYPIDNPITHALLGGTIGGHKTLPQGLVDGMVKGPMKESQVQVGKTPAAVTHEWYRVTFPESYPSPPVVVPQLVSEQGWENCHLDVKGVDRTGFSVRIEEDKGLDGDHSNGEVVHWIAVPDGGYGLLKAGKTGQVVTHDWYQVTFPQSFAEDPVVVAQIVTERGQDNCHLDLKKVSPTGFKVRVEEDMREDGVHDNGESVHWMAILPGKYMNAVKAGKTENVVTHNWYSVVYNYTFGHQPVLVAQLVTELGGDNCHVDLKGINPDYFKARVEEDSDQDGTHRTGEGVHYIAVCQ